MSKKTFPRRSRLLIPNHFSFVFQKSRNVGTEYVVILGRFNTLNYPRIGLVVAKKQVKKAHQRNRVKRVIRESFRLCQSILPDMDFVVIIKHGAINLSNRSLTAELKKLWYHYYQLSRHC